MQLEVLEPTYSIQDWGSGVADPWLTPTDWVTYIRTNLPALVSTSSYFNGGWSISNTKVLCVRVSRFQLSGIVICTQGETDVQRLSITPGPVYQWDGSDYSAIDLSPLSTNIGTFGLQVRAQDYGELQNRNGNWYSGVIDSYNNVDDYLRITIFGAPQLMCFNSAST